MAVGEIEQIPLGWGDRMVPLHSYVALYYSTPEAIQRALAFLRVGLDEDGTFCIFLAEEARKPALLDALQDGYAGDVRRAVSDGKLVAASWTPTFDNLTTTVMGRLDEALAGGYLRIRALGLVAWAEVGWGDVEWLKRCEAAINWAAALYPMVILCTYRIPELPQELVREGMADEPVVVVNQALGP